MNNFFRFFSFYLMLILSASCENNSNTHMLENVDHFLPTFPDSADSVLNSIDDYNSLNENDKALYGLLRTYTDNRLHKGVKSDSIIRPAYFYYKDKSNAGECNDSALISRYASSCYYLGLYYSNCDSTKQCEDLMRESIKFSEKCHDWHTCYLAYIILSNSVREANSEYATKLALKALDTYNKINDDLNNKILICGKIAECYGWCLDFDSSLIYFLKGYNIAKNHGLTKSLNTMCMGLAGIYWMDKQFDKALKYAKEGIETADSEVITNSKITLALCYLETDSLAKAKELLLNINCDSDDYINKAVIHRNLANIAILQKDYQGISNHMDSAYINLEDKYFHIQKVKDDYYQENIKSIEQKDLLVLQNEKDKWIIITRTSLLIVAAIFSFYLIKSKHKLSVEKNKIIELQDCLIHQKSVSLSLLQQHLVNANNEIRKVMTNDNAQLPESLWKEAETVLDDTDNLFVSNLRKAHPEFREDDIRLCIAVRLKITNNQIANLFNIGVSAVKKRKSSLKKTGFNINDPLVSLEEIVEKL